MGNKLVYISGKAYWLTPEGDFNPAEMRDGMPIEHVIMRSAAETEKPL